MSDSQPAEEPPNPLDEQRRLMELLGQNTRHLVIKAILGHPQHLASLDELNYMVENKTRKTVGNAADKLVEEGILAIYERPENEDTRGIPYQFFGLTEYGIDVLGDFNYLKGVPLNRALYEKTRKSDKIERHESAPRPDLPDLVQEALAIEETAEAVADA